MIRGATYSLDVPDASQDDSGGELSLVVAHVVVVHQVALHGECRFSDDGRLDSPR
jgi:hypothetical protein